MLPLATVPQSSGVKLRVDPKRQTAPQVVVHGECAQSGEERPGIALHRAEQLVAAGLLPPAARNRLVSPTTDVVASGQLAPNTGLADGGIARTPLGHAVVA